MLLADPNTVFFLDGKRHKVTMANPLPVSAWNLDRIYVAWASEGESCDEDGNGGGGRQHYINVVNGGPTRASHINEYIRSASCGKGKDMGQSDGREVGGGSCSSPTASAAAAATPPGALGQGNASVDGDDGNDGDDDGHGDVPTGPSNLEGARAASQLQQNAQVRVAKRYHLSEDRETLFMSSRVHFFGEHSAPDFSDTEMLRRMCLPGLPSEVGHYTSKFIKVFAAPELFGGEGGGGGGCGVPGNGDELDMLTSM